MMRSTMRAARAVFEARLPHTPARTLHATGAALAHVLLLDGINPMAAQVLEDAGHTADVSAAMPEEELLTVRKIFRRR